MNEPLLSVIIPIYNVEAYLRECLNSVISQTYPKWECILIDDASTDGSADIAREFCNADSRFRLYCHKENRGLSAARNSGLDNAAGALITFVDSDDFIRSEMFRCGIEYLEREDVDIVCFGFENERNVKKVEFCDAKTMLERILYQTGSTNGSSCGKIFTKRLFTELRFTEGTTYEDLDIVDRIFIQARNVVVVAEQMYHYRRREGSIINTWSLSRLDVLNVTARMEARQTDAGLQKAARDRRFAANFNMLLLMRKNGLGNTEEARGCRAQLRRLNGEVMCNPLSRLKNRVGAVLARLLYGSAR